MADELDAILAEWAAKQPEILSLFVFGSRARGDARADSDLDLAFELDNTREPQLAVLIATRARWQRELAALTGLVVRDLYLWDTPEVSGPARAIYARVAGDFDPGTIDLGNWRPVNGFWAYRDKSVGEPGAANEILKSAGFAIERLVGCKSDPPDCEATIGNRHAGIEVTELVHFKALKRSLKIGKPIWFPWDQVTFAAALQCIIDRKETAVPRWQGGPYDRWMLVVHTDEPHLSQSVVGRFLEGKRFRARFFSDVVLGLSYDPTTASIPTFCLTLDEREN
jgi:predicted nucleotidyltransferase